MISTQCPQCAKQYSLEDKFLNNELRCPCGTTFNIENFLPIATQTTQSPASSKNNFKIAGALVVATIGLFVFKAFRSEPEKPAPAPVVKAVQPVKKAALPKVPPIHQAAKEGDLATVERLLRKDPALVNQMQTVDRKRSPLHFAKTAAVAGVLLKHGANILVEDRFSWTPLHTAANAEVAEFLIKKGADVRARAQKDFTPLHTAANADVAIVLLNAGANINGEINPKKRYGSLGMRDTPLYWNIQRNRPDVVNVLIKAGANVQQRMSSDRTLLHFAASRGYGEIITLLVKTGGLWVDIKDRHRAAPVHYAVMNDKVKSVEALVALGADLNVRLPKNIQVQKFSYGSRTGMSTSSRDVSGKTPLGMATSTAMRNLLLHNDATF